MHRTRSHSSNSFSSTRDAASSSPTSLSSSSVSLTQSRLMGMLLVVGVILYGVQMSVMMSSCSNVAALAVASRNVPASERRVQELNTPSESLLRQTSDSTVSPTVASTIEPDTLMQPGTDAPQEFEDTTEPPQTQLVNDATAKTPDDAVMTNTIVPGVLEDLEAEIGTGREVLPKGTEKEEDEEVTTPRPLLRTPLTPPEAKETDDLLIEDEETDATTDNDEIMFQDDKQPVVTHEKGIIMCLHDGIVPMGVSLIKELRCLGNREIIQVYHCLPSELSDSSKALLTLNDPYVEIIDVCTQMIEKGIFDQKMAASFQSYWIKPLALYATKLNEVILLDADAILLRNPSDLRTYVPGYVETGTLFFHDRVINIRDFFNKPIQHTGRTYLMYWIKAFDYQRFGLNGLAPSTHLLNSFAFKGKTCHEQDSSMVLIDKRRPGASRALDVLWYLITEHRFKYTFSWGDKESFWLAYEFAQVPYFFSPWGVAGIESTPNDDMKLHPKTMCGSMAHYMPVMDDTPELLYVNGKALLEPFPLGIEESLKARRNRMYNLNPAYVTPRQVRSSVGVPEQGRDFTECLTGLGSTRLPKEFGRHLMRRRIHFFAIKTNFLDPLESCEAMPV